jgi:alkylation response protein AidB-like acyl-CoA dehydrogenase
MRFSFTAEQLELRDAVRDLLARECTPAVVRAAWTAPAGQLDRRAWERLAEMGVLHVLVPEAEGGLGLDFCSLVLLLEETGRVALPHPVVETAAVAAPLLGARTGSGLVGACLGGEPVACAADLDRVVVDDGGALYLAEPAQVRFEAVESVDRARRLGSLAAIADGAERLRAGAGELEAALDRAAVGTAAQLIGLSQTMLDLAVAHVRERRQFGVAVGSFQAVKHQLADCLTELSFARPAVYRAAWSVANDLPSRSEDVSTAKSLASEAALYVARRALQCHGAIGYTVEHDLHLYLKRAWAVARAFGDAAWHRRRLAAALGLPGVPHEQGETA